MRILTTPLSSVCIGGGGMGGGSRTEVYSFAPGGTNARNRLFMERLGLSSFLWVFFLFFFFVGSVLFLFQIDSEVFHT